MVGRLRRARAGLRAVFNEMRSQEISFIAGSVAYHAFVSLLPILLLATFLVSVLGWPALSDRVLAVAGTYLPELGRRIVAEAVRDAAGGFATSLIGAAVLLWGTFKIFRELDAAFSELYDVEHEKPARAKVRDAAVVFAALAAAVGVAVVLGPLVRLPRWLPASGVLDWFVSTAGLAAAFFPIYYVFPDVEVTPREVVPGVVVAAVGWTALQWLFRFYVGVSGKPDLFGFVGGFLVLVTWLYVSAFVLLLGGSVNATLAGRTGDRAARADPELGSDEDRIADDADLERRVAGAVSRARDADVDPSAIRSVLQEQADRVEAGDVRTVEDGDEPPADGGHGRGEERADAGSTAVDPVDPEDRTDQRADGGSRDGADGSSQRRERR